jgi:NTE family protein
MTEIVNDSPVLIQLAIQGGGAKLAALLAVLEAVQNAEKAGHVQVTRIAGTSAGAIAGALYGARIPIAQVRQALQATTPEERSRLFPSLSTFGAAMNLLRNRPFWSTKELRNLLSKLLKLNESSVRTLGDIRKKGIELLIISSDLRNAQQHLFDDESDVLVNALIESAAIPFFYRTWPNQDGLLLVDGGICQNLPSEELHKRELERPGGGVIVGITFQEMTVNEAPTTLISFSKALLETAMNSAILRARENVKWTLPVATKIDTFDFETAFTEGLGDSYVVVRNDASQRLQQIVDEERQAKLALVIPPPIEHKLKLGLWKQSSEWMKTQLREIYARQHEGRPFKYYRLSLVVQANCLLEPGEVGSTLPDSVLNKLQFAPDSEPIFCHRLGVDSPSANQDNFMNDPSWSIVDRHGLAVNAIPLPISSITKGKREFLLFFSPPLQAEVDTGMPYTLRVYDWVKDAMGPLKENGVDELVVRGHRAFSPVPRVDLVLFLPSTYDADFVAHAKSDAPGRLMTPEELIDYAPPAGFRVLGWVGNDVPGGSRFSVRVEAPGRVKTAEVSGT